MTDKELPFALRNILNSAGSQEVTVTIKLSADALKMIEGLARGAQKTFDQQASAMLQELADEHLDSMTEDERVFIAALPPFEGGPGL